MQTVIRQFTDTNATRLYIFLDDLHYLPSVEQPKLLDLVHGAVRDSDAWLKVARESDISQAGFKKNPCSAYKPGMTQIILIWM